MCVCVWLLIKKNSTLFVENGMEAGFMLDPWTGPCTSAVYIFKMCRAHSTAAYVKDVHSGLVISAALS